MTFWFNRNFDSPNEKLGASLASRLYILLNYYYNPMKLSAMIVDIKNNGGNIWRLFSTCVQELYHVLTELKAGHKAKNEMLS